MFSFMLKGMQASFQNESERLIFKDPFLFGHQREKVKAKLKTQTDSRKQLIRGVND